jgi:site-specific DNA-cytosine methylase
MQEGITVLSLFDGMSCGQIALERAGIKVKQYFASEIDKYAIKITQKNYPSTIQIGDVSKVHYKDGILYTDAGEYNIGKIDLLIGGSPCQSFSNLGDGSGFDGKSGLFFEYLRLRNEVTPKYFLLENVKMNKQWLTKIDEYMGTKGVLINSSLVSAQSRGRYYWTNVPFTVPEDKGITLSDIISKEVPDKYYLSEKAKKYIVSKDRLKKALTNVNGDKSSTLLARYTGLNGTFLCVDCNGRLDHEKAGTLVARYGKGVSSFGGDTFVLDAENLNDYRIRKFTPEECESLQTVPLMYTSGVADTHRYKMIGNGWTVDVIAHIFKGLTL